MNYGSLESWGVVGVGLKRAFHICYALVLVLGAIYVAVIVTILFYGCVVYEGILLIYVFLKYIANMPKHIYLNLSSSQPSVPPTSTSDDSRTTTIEGSLDQVTLDIFPITPDLYFQLKPYKGNSTASCSCCSICLADYEATDMVKLLPECGHMYHLNSIDPWLSLHPTCPVCRSPVTNSLFFPPKLLEPNTTVSWNVRFGLIV